MNNPYTTPKSNVREASSTDNMNIFPRFSAWGVFGLTIITFGVYYVYWLYTRTAKINEVVDDKIPSWLVNASLTTYVLYIAINFIPEEATENIAVALSMAAIVIGYIVFYYWWLYSVRSRIHSLSNDSDFKIGPILTFFFQPIYFQYKINQYLDNHPE